MRGVFRSTDGVRLAFERSGLGTTLVLQHGLGASAAQPIEVISAEAGLESLVMECRGHGDSELGPPDRLGVGTFTGDLARLLDHLAIDNCIVGGISMGAAVALSFAVRFPSRTRALVLARPAWVLEKAPEHLRVFDEIARLMRTKSADAGRALFAASPTFKHCETISPDNGASLLAQFEAPDLQVRAALLSCIASDGPEANRGDLAAIACPTLVIGNDLDVIHPLKIAREVASLIPRAKFSEITSKSISKARYLADFRAELTEFCARVMAEHDR